MHLEVNGVKLSVAQLGPDFLILAETAAIEARRGEVVLRVDGHESRWLVDLPAGLGAVDERTPIMGRQRVLDMRRPTAATVRNRQE
jgi:hypothetical protein